MVTDAAALDVDVSEDAICGFGSPLGYSPLCCDFQPFRFSCHQRDEKWTPTPDCRISPYVEFLVIKDRFVHPSPFEREHEQDGIRTYCKNHYGRDNRAAQRSICVTSDATGGFV